MKQALLVLLPMPCLVGRRLERAGFFAMIFGIFLGREKT